MAALIEDYGLIGDTETVALVSRRGSIDWFCAPRFDSPACFAALLGTEANGRWSIEPAGTITAITRCYRGDTLVLETEFTTESGVVAVFDFMPVRKKYPSIVRIVEGREGTVPMCTEFAIRFDYGSIVPWVRAVHHGVAAVAGADGLVLHLPGQPRSVNLTSVLDFEVTAGQRLSASLTWFPSHRSPPAAFDRDGALEETENWWKTWVSHCRYDGDWRDEVVRSLITLKALTYAPTGGIVAAATTSLPEHIGGVRNWDYRYCWLRDATFTLHALLDAGYNAEATAWCHWLRRAVAGSPDALQIMYGVGGERRLTELELDWLPGYEGSTPVRIGNAASGQFQLDVFGEVLDMLRTEATVDGHLGDDAVDLARLLVEHVERVWVEPDDGIWEVRGPRRHFVHSKVMAWVAIDRWIQIVEMLGLEDPLRRWRDLRDVIHADVCTKGFDSAKNAFTQFYGGTELDASALVLALVGFLPPTDPRIIGTVEAIERELVVDGFVLRYRTTPGARVHKTGEESRTVASDGLPPGEGAFLLTTFWLVDNLALIGRVDDAREMFDRLLGLRNDLGLLSEEYDVGLSRMVGNFPQAFSHIGLVNSAANLSPDALHAIGPSRRRPDTMG